MPRANGSKSRSTSAGSTRISSSWLMRPPARARTAGSAAIARCSSAPCSPRRLGSCTSSTRHGSGNSARNSSGALPPSAGGPASTRKPPLSKPAPPMPERSPRPSSATSSPVSSGNAKALGERAADRQRDLRARAEAGVGRQRLVQFDAQRLVAAGGAAQRVAVCGQARRVVGAVGDDGIGARRTKVQARGRLVDDQPDAAVAPPERRAGVDEAEVQPRRRTHAHGARRAAAGRSITEAAGEGASVIRALKQTEGPQASEGLRACAVSRRHATVLRWRRRFERQRDLRQVLARLDEHQRAVVDDRRRFGSRCARDRCRLARPSPAARCAPCRRRN